MKNKNNKKNAELRGQLSIFDEFFQNMRDFGNNLSKEDLAVAIESLNIALSEVKKQEARQKEIERKQKEEEKRRKAEEKAQREKERKEKHIAEVTSMDLPLDWNNYFDSDERTKGIHIETVADALIMSLTTLGRVDIEYISSVTGKDYKTCIKELKGSIYQNPDTWNECFYKGWETSDEYLSGNLMRKWQTAKTANEEYNGYFSQNVKAIEKILPPTVATKDIYITLGSPWVPTDIIDDFITHLLGSCSGYGWGSLETMHDEITGTWEIPFKTRYNYTRNSVAANTTYGTSRISALHIIEKTLNMKTISVTDEVSCPTNKSGVKRVINKKETLIAMEKQKLIIEEFQKWVWQNPLRKERLEIIFENNFSCVKARHFDGSFLSFPGMSEKASLYPYQKNAVARILFSPNTLLAHDVGAGKTYIMIAAAMELRRMGLSKKNLFVIPNNLTEQWRNIFLELYPNANILCVTPNKFSAQKREEMLETIRDNDYDAILMAYSCFELIPLSREYYKNAIEEQKAVIAQAAQARNKATSKLKQKEKALNEALFDLETAIDNLYNSVYFDELGVNYLFVDEAHNFKNVPITSKVDKVLGINKKGSSKCQDMLDKVHCVQRQNDGKGVVFATGTPITNSITDAYIMQSYLQSGELALLDLQSFDSWIGMFAEKVSEFEIDVDTNNYRLATRFAKFHNLPELTSLLASIADFHSVASTSEIPETDGYTDALIGKTKEFADYLDNISVRADVVRSGMISRKDDNMLKITTDGRKAALDLRLVDSNALFTYQSKVARCAENVFDIYNKTSSNKGTQLIFCDTSTPKNDFNMYDELANLLVDMGVSSDDIAYIHDADTEKKKDELFRKMRAGEVRILIGSTFKLGLGVNVQDKLIALHHLDVPWRPADMVQREGRILRQGNTNKKVYIYRYITEGSFDAYSWQLLETKQRFISDLLAGSLSQRCGADIDDTVLNYAEVKALAIGNPLIKKRVETANELTRYMTLQRKMIETKQNLEKELLEIPAEIAQQEDYIEKCKNDIVFYSKNKVEHDKDQRKVIRDTIFEAVKKNFLRENESKLMCYCGFDIILPKNMVNEKPFVWLQKNGRYYVELGDSAVGTLIRIDNCLDDLEARLVRLEDKLSILKAKRESIINELNKKESYTDEIQALQTKLEEIDKDLGVNKK